MKRLFLVSALSLVPLIAVNRIYALLDGGR
jgi:hypothetical protein